MRKPWMPWVAVFVLGAVVGFALSELKPPKSGGASVGREDPGWEVGQQFTVQVTDTATQQATHNELRVTRITDTRESLSHAKKPIQWSGNVENVKSLWAFKFDGVTYTAVCIEKHD